MPKIKKTFLFAVITLVFFIPILVYAVEPYVPIEEIPLVGRQTELINYLKGIFQFGVAAIAIVSMLVIMIGGYLYIFSGGSKGMEKAKSMIVNALLGLGLALVSWIIVYTINPDLIELKGIRSVDIDIKGSGGDGITNFGLCSVMETKWKENKAAVGSMATMVFTLGDLCTDKASEIILEGEVWEYDPGPGDDFVSRFTFTKSKGEIIRTLNNGKPSIYWEAKWEVPPILENGDEVYFKVLSKATIDGKVEQSAFKENQNSLLSISSSTLDPLCTIKEVNWLLPPTKADITGIDAEFGVRTSLDCRELDKVTRRNKFALKMEIFNRGNGADHAVETSEKVFQHTAELSDNLIKMPFIIPPPNPRPDGFEGTYLKTSVSPGNYFIEATVVYADNPIKLFTPTSRSTPGKDLNVQ